MLGMIKKSVLNKDYIEKAHASLIYAVITPQCDLAHPRYLRSENTSSSGKKIDSWHRIVWGIEIEVDDDRYGDMFQKASDYCQRINFIDDLQSVSVEDKKKLKKYIQNCKPESIFSTSPLINVLGKKCIWVFHFASVTTKCLKEKQRFKYQMSRELVFDLQSKLANHVNRLGNNMLEC